MYKILWSLSEIFESNSFFDSNSAGNRTTENGNVKKRQLPSGGSSSDSDKSIEMELKECFEM